MVTAISFIARTIVALTGIAGFSGFEGKTLQATSNHLRMVHGRDPMEVRDVERAVGARALPPARRGETGCRISQGKSTGGAGPC
jgi:hypothetical protein